jgi:hypothetical protein
MKNNTTHDVARQAIEHAEVEIEAWSEAVAVARREGVSVELRDLLETNLTAAIDRRASLRNVPAIERAFVAKRVANRLDRRDLHAEAARQFADLAADGRYAATERDGFMSHAAEHDNRSKGNSYIPAE